MADNDPVPEGTPQPPATPHAPPPKAGVVGKVVVALSSVAKAPPPIPVKQAPVEAKLVSPTGNELKQPPKVVAPLKALPPGTPNTASPESTPDMVRVRPHAPPLVKVNSKKTTARLLIPSIKLNQPAPPPVIEEEVPRESIILGPGDTVQEHPIRLPKIVEKPAVIPPIPVPVPVVEEKPPVVAPMVTLPVAQPLVILPPIGPVVEPSTALQPPIILSKVDATPIQPPPLPTFKPLEKPAPSGVQVVPKMATSEPVAPAEKLRPPPQFPHEGGVPATSLPPVVPPAAALPPVAPPETTGLHRAPALISAEPAKDATLPPALPLKLAPPALPELKAATLVTEKPAPAIVTAKSTPPPLEPLVQATKQLLAKQEENKPALRPAVLPNKALNNPKTVEPIAPLVVIESKDKGTTAVPPVLSPKPEAGKLHSPVELHKAGDKPPILPKEKPPLPLTRVERAKKRRVGEMILFYVVLVVVGALLYFGMIHFSQETRVEGQVIPPSGMPLADEVWIVSDFRQQAADIAEDDLRDRTPVLQEMHERQDHVQRVQADIAMREERIRLLQAQIQSAKDAEVDVVKQSRDQAQALWDGPGVELDDDYNARQRELQNAIANRAKSLNLKYSPDPTYNAPEVWANAYRLALYEVPAGVDSAKEYDWLNGQMKAWRDFVKAQDDKREQLREQAAQIKTAPAAKLADLNAKIEELQHRIESTQTEEDPLKPELQQAQSDLAESETSESNIDPKYYKELSALPSGSIIKRLPVEINGRFTWGNLEKDSPFAEDENEHHYWIFARATRADGREYWALGRFSITKNHTLGLLIEPDSFVSTKALLRPELSPDEQAQ